MILSGFCRTWFQGGELFLRTDHRTSRHFHAISIIQSSKREREKKNTCLAEWSKILVKLQLKEKVPDSLWETPHLATAGNTALLFYLFICLSFGFVSFYNPGGLQPAFSFSMRAEILPITHHEYWTEKAAGAARGWKCVCMRGTWENLVKRGKGCD